MSPIDDEHTLATMMAIESALDAKHIWGCCSLEIEPMLFIWCFPHPDHAALYVFARSGFGSALSNAIAVTAGALHSCALLRVLEACAKAIFDARDPVLRVMLKAITRARDAVANALIDTIQEELDDE